MPTPNEGESQKDFVARCIPIVLEDETAEDNDQAVAICNSMWEESQEESAMELGEIAKQAIETARAVCNDSVMLAKLAEAGGQSPQQVANRMLDELEKQLGESAETQSDEAEMPGGLSVDESVLGSLQDFANRVQSAFTARFETNPNDYPRDYYTRDVFDSSSKLGAVLIVDDHREGATFAVTYAQIETGFDFQPRGEWRRAMLTYTLESPAEESDALQNVGLALESHDATEEDTANLTEAEAATVETGRRAPVIVDFQMITPGPGNKRDRHYYPADVLKRDISVFGEADVFATDHKAEQRSELTKVGKVLKVPIRFTEDQAPVARVLIYDPAQAEKARNRADADALSTLECSIYGSGRAKPRKIDGVEYKVVEAITEGKYLELVSKAGAGGHALNLAESDGGETMSGEDETRETEGDEETTQEVNLAEGEQQGTQEETTEEAEPLAEAEVSEVLAEIRLPDKVKALLAAQSYADKAALDSAIAEMVEEFKEATGSGKPTVRRSAVRKPKPKNELAEVGKAQDAVNAKFLRTRMNIQEDAK